jgi:hypothetical protein
MRMVSAIEVTVHYTTDQNKARGIGEKGTIGAIAPFFTYERSNPFLHHRGKNVKKGDKLW